jgi:hypothetical protein
MKAQTVDIRESTGRILCCTIFRPGGKKLLAKGHLLNEEDIKLLQNEGMAQVWVTELEDGEVSEDDAVMQVARELGCGGLEIRLAAVVALTWSRPKTAACWWMTSCSNRSTVQQAS